MTPVGACADRADCGDDSCRKELRTQRQATQSGLDAPWPGVRFFLRWCHRQGMINGMHHPLWLTLRKPKTGHSRKPKGHSRLRQLKQMEVGPLLGGPNLMSGF